MIRCQSCTSSSGEKRRNRGSRADSSQTAGTVLLMWPRRPSLENGVGSAFPAWMSTPCRRTAHELTRQPVRLKRPLPGVEPPPVSGSCAPPVRALTRRCENRTSRGPSSRTPARPTQLQPVVKQRHEPALALHLGQQGAGPGSSPWARHCVNPCHACWPPHTRRSKGCPSEARRKGRRRAHAPGLRVPNQRSTSSSSPLTQRPVVQGTHLEAGSLICQQAAHGAGAPR